jgi:predicted dehydrogenase
MLSVWDRGFAALDGQESDAEKEQHGRCVRKPSPIAAPAAAHMYNHPRPSPHPTPIRKYHRHPAPMTSPTNQALSQAQRSLSTVVLGLGSRGLEHARMIQQVPALRLRGLYDVQYEPRQRASRLTGVPAFSNLDQLFGECQPELVVIATPPGVRLELVERVGVVEGGVRSILLEKPIALSLSEALKIIDLCREHRVALRIGHQLRFSPEFMQLKRHLDEGALGELQSVQASCYGNLLDQGAHMVDLVCWLAGGRAALEVSARASDDLPQLARSAPIRPEYVPDRAHPAPASVQAAIAFEGGLTAGVDAGVLAPIALPNLGAWMQKRVVAVGTRGRAEAHVGAHFQSQADGGEAPHNEIFTLDDYTKATRSMHADLAAAIQDGRADSDSAPLRAAAEILFGALHSGFTGETVTLPITDPERLQTAPLREPRRYAVTAPAKAQNRPRLSVIVSMAEHRGLGVRSVEAWVAQRCDPGLYELLFICDSRLSEKLVAQFRTRLRPWDRCLSTDSLVETEQYVEAARGARGDYLFFAEAHVFPEPELVEQTIRFLDREDYAGFCVRSSPLPGNHFSSNETRQFREEFREWSKPGNFAKVFARGFCIRTQVYWELGGHEHRYHRFADAIMAARLKARGHELAYAPSVGVAHLDELEVHGLAYSLRHFVEGESRFRQETPADWLRLFFGEPPEWIEASAFDRFVVQRFCRLLFREITRLQSGLSLSFRFLRGPLELLRLLPLAIFGGHILVLRMQARRIESFLRYYLLIAFPNGRYKAYLDWYAATVAYYRVRYALQHRPRRPEVTEPRFRYSMEDVDARDLSGFHAVELHAGKAFRWSGTAAGLRLHLPAGDYQVELSLLGVRPIRGRHIALYIDDRRLSSVQIDEAGTEVKAPVPRSALASGKDHQLTIVAAPLPEARVQGPARRLLGVAVREVTFTSPA